MDAFLGEIRIFCGFAANALPPSGWALCDGQALTISDNQGLYSLIGTMYGSPGAGKFNLPNLNGRVVLGAGQGPGLTNYNPGDVGGADAVALTEAQIPSHTHALNASQNQATANVPGTGVVFASPPPPGRLYDDMNLVTGGNANFSPQAVSTEGRGATHDNVMPTMALRYIISLAGIYPNFQ